MKIRGARLRGARRLLRGSLLAALLAVACVLPAQAAKLHKGTFVLLRTADSVTLDPARAFDSESTLAVQQIYEGLVRVKSGKAQIEPALAESWSVSPDKLVWTFRMRKGVLFHDGSTLTARDAAQSITRQIDPKDPYHAPGMYTAQLLFENIAGAEALDDSTLRVHLRRPTASLLSSLASAQASVVSSKALARWGSALGEHPVGTGPFQFVEWTRGESLMLERNKVYWGPKARMERVVLRTLSDPGARFREFQAGRADALVNVMPSDLPLVEKVPGATVLRAPGLNIAYLGLNTQRGPLRKASVRRAVALALNRVLLVNLVYGHSAEPALSPLPPVLLDVRDQFPPQTLRGDVQKARAILAQEGLGHGFDAALLVMDTPRPYLPEPQRMAQAIRQSLSAVGIRVRIRTVPWAEYLAQVSRGEHEFCLSGWSYGDLNPHEFFRHKLGRGDLSKGVGSNVSLWSDKEFADLVTKAEATDSVAERTRLYRQILGVVAREAPLVPLAHMMSIIAVQSGVHGVVMQPTGAELRLSRVYKD